LYILGPNENGSKGSYQYLVKKNKQKKKKINEMKTTPKKFVTYDKPLLQSVDNITKYKSESYISIFIILLCYYYHYYDYCNAIIDIVIEENNQ
jgi:hypothetical protein